MMRYAWTDLSAARHHAAARFGSCPEQEADIPSVVKLAWLEVALTMSVPERAGDICRALHGPDACVDVTKREAKVFAWTDVGLIRQTPRLTCVLPSGCQ